ncbi:MAG: hypothetical protein COX30_03245 [Candidatus Moranbacteria bacterium CG23_combo_of_CG06-09_8_20_14_all_39_10]|nr:MAG: hypothetical protein COX30_03245 [Candidatus Moranbacteria bacterium CG23_combo_of_CG06-09_8_20_14_all_39_10]
MNLEKILENYGLEKKQAQLYLICLELGSASAYKIAKRAGLPRSTCYEVLEFLWEKDLVSIFYKKKVKIFNAEDPQNVIALAKEKIELFEEAIPQFAALYGNVKIKPATRFYQGKDGMKIILEEMLKDRGKEILSFGSAKDYVEYLESYWPRFLEKRLKNKILIRSILRESPEAKIRKELGVQQLREVKILPSKYEHHGLTVIWSNKVAMFSFQKNEMALVIESQEIAQTQKVMFNFMWDSLE